jgi:hypothetical protein
MAPWIPSLPAFTSSPINLSHLSNPSLTIRDLLNPDSSWNTPLLLSLFDPTSIREILKIKVGLPHPSTFLWSPSPNGNFSSKSAFNLISSPRLISALSHLNPNSWKKLWKLQLNDRLKLFLWKIFWDILHTKTRLNSFLSFPPSKLFCPLCKSEPDSIPHLLFRCVFLE